MIIFSNGKYLGSKLDLTKINDEYPVSKLIEYSSSIKSFKTQFNHPNNAKYRTLIYNLFSHNDILLAVPSSNKRRVDHSITETANIHNTSKHHLSKTIYRKYDVPTQKKLSFSERLTPDELSKSLALTNEFVRYAKNNPHKPIYIIDDVATSGNSLNSVKLALNQRNIKNKVFFFVLANNVEINKGNLSPTALDENNVKADVVELKKEPVNTQYVYMAQRLNISEEQFKAMINFSYRDNEPITVKLRKLTTKENYIKIIQDYELSIKSGIKFVHKFTQAKIHNNCFNFTKNYILAYKGNYNLLSPKKNAIITIGSRKTTGAIIPSLASKLAKKKPEVIVSGLAKGADTAAHIVALDHLNKPTIAIVANGLNATYPIENTQLAQRIVKNGLIVSANLDPLGHVTPYRLLERNLMMLNYSRNILLVQGKENSGSSKLVNYAIKNKIKVDALSSTNKYVSENALNISIEKHNKQSLHI